MMNVRAAAARDLQARFKLSLGYHYSSGTYGTSDRTDIAYVPLIAKAEIGFWSIQATVPYLRISGPAGFVEGPQDVCEALQPEPNTNALRAGAHTAGIITNSQRGRWAAAQDLLPSTEESTDTGGSDRPIAALPVRVA
jgi:hypothetical protein